MEKRKLRSEKYHTYPISYFYSHQMFQSYRLGLISVRQAFEKNPGRRMHCLWQILHRIAWNSLNGETNMGPNLFTHKKTKESVLTKFHPMEATSYYPWNGSFYFLGDEKQWHCITVHIIKRKRKASPNSAKGGQIKPHGICIICRCLSDYMCREAKRHSSRIVSLKLRG